MGVTLAMHVIRSPFPAWALSLQKLASTAHEGSGGRRPPLQGLREGAHFGASHFKVGRLAAARTLVGALRQQGILRTYKDDAACV